MSDDSSGSVNRDSIFSSSQGEVRRSLPKIEIVSIRILERWDETINTFQLWKRWQLQNDAREEGMRSQVHACLYALFLMNEHFFQRSLSEGGGSVEFALMKQKALSSSLLSGEEIQSLFQLMNKQLDEFRLIRVDLPHVKRTIEEINTKRGFN